MPNSVCNSLYAVDWSQWVAKTNSDQDHYLVPRETSTHWKDKFFWTHYLISIGKSITLMINLSLEETSSNTVIISQRDYFTKTIFQII